MILAEMHKTESKVIPILGYVLHSNPRSASEAGPCLPLEALKLLVA
jgi:hypothetical protein